MATIAAASASASQHYAHPSGSYGQQHLANGTSREQHRQQQQVQHEQPIETQRQNDQQDEEDGAEDEQSSTFLVRAVYPYAGEDDNQLSFERGDYVEVLGMEASGWWDGILVHSTLPTNGTRGWFPNNFVAKVTDDELPRVLALLGIPDSEPSQSNANGQEDEVGSPQDTNALVSGAGLDILLGRRGTDGDSSAIDIDQVFRWGSSGPSGSSGATSQDEEDLTTSFSTGGDIFGEIAAAAAASANGFSEDLSVRNSQYSDGSVDVEGADKFDERGMLRSHQTPKPGRPIRDSGNVDGDWIPKMSSDGRLFYYNTRTGDSALELPSSDPTSPSSITTTGSRHPHSRADSSATAGGAGVNGNVRGSGSATVNGSSSNSHKGSSSISMSSSTSMDSLARQALAKRGLPASSSNLSSLLAQQEGLSKTPLLDNDDDQPLALRAATQQRPISMYSDDSALDAELSPHRGGSARNTSLQNSQQLSSTLPRSGTVTSVDPGATPRKVSAVTVNTLEPTRTQPVEVLFAEELARLEAVKRLVMQEPYSTLGELEQACHTALEKLRSLMQSKQDGLQSSSTSLSFEEQEAADRVKLEQISDSITDSTRRLLAGTDMIIEQQQQASDQRASQPDAQSGIQNRHTSTSSVASDLQLVPLPPLVSSGFRALALQLVTRESKLLLSIRTTWGCLDTSPAEEEAVLRSRDSEELSAEEKAQQAKDRQLQVTARKEYLSRLSADMMVQIKMVSEAVTAFVDEIEAHASRSGLSASKQHLVVPKRIEGQLQIREGSLLLSVATCSAAFGGHGFARRDSLESRKNQSRPTSLATPSSYSFPQSVRSSTVTSLEPSRPLVASTIDALATERKALMADLANLRTILLTLLGANTREKSLKYSLLQTVTSQAMQLLNRLAKLMHDVEQVDISSRLDIELDLETFISLTGENVQSAADKGVLPSMALGALKTSSSAAIAYFELLAQTQVLLNGLQDIKARLYDVPGSLLQTVQTLVQTPTMAFASSSYTSAPTPSQPPLSSPLGAFTSPVHSGATTGAILDILGVIDQQTNDLLQTLAALSAVADEQANAPAELRRPNFALRASLADLSAPMSALSNTSSAATLDRYNNRRSAEDDSAEELDSHKGDTSSYGGASGANYLYSTTSASTPTSSQRTSFDRSTVNSASLMMQRNTSAQSSVFRNTGGARQSRSNSLADSFTSERSGSISSGYAKRDAAEDLRNAIQEAGLGGSGSPTNHSPSKSKLKQFFGTDAPGTNVHRPPTASRETPVYLQPDYTHDQISYANDGSIRAGTMHALVCRLTNHMSADTNYNNAFLMTYRTFTTSTELLDRLQARYNLEPPHGLKKEDQTLWAEQKQKLVRIRVINVIRSWITDYLYDDDEGLTLDRVAAFSVTLPKESSQQVARLIERRRMTGAPRRLTASVSAGMTPPPIVPRNLKRIKFLDVDPLELARQFTIMDSKLFAKITTEECLSKAWPKKFQKDMPNFRAIAEMSNAVTGWVAVTIVTQSDARRRAAVIKHFIAIADKCRQLANFTTLMQIVAGLNCGAIYRLKRTWELVNQRSHATLTYLVNLMSPENNCALYRDALRLVGSPCVPFLGVYFTDWVMGSEANKDMLRDKPDQINFAKRARVAESIQQIQLHQATPYNLAAVPGLVKWIEEDLRQAKTAGPDGSGSLLTVDEQLSRAYDLSLKIEPREREDERIARLLSESGFL